MQVKRSFGRRALRVCIAAHSFAIGGGEIAPIILANALRRRGHEVRYLVVDDADLRGERHVRARLDPEVPVFRWNGRGETFQAFVRAHDIEIVNSHNLSVDVRLHLARLPTLPKYVASLHGGYESTPQCMTPAFLASARRVDRWLYLAEKNLTPLRAAGLDEARFVRSFNAVEAKPAVALDRRTVRAFFGLPSDAFVLALAARGTPEKGWATAIEVARRLQGAGRAAHIVLAGEGPAAEALRARYGHEPFVTFAGHVESVRMLLSACDLALFPSTFAGESMPLFLLECFSVGLPALATDLGRIPDMFGPAGEERPGVLFPAHAAPSELAGGMAVAAAAALAHPDQLARWRANARRCAARFDVEALADLYEATFCELLGERAPLAPDAARDSSGVPLGRYCPAAPPRPDRRAAEMMKG